jgi:CheY-like chemotaxis protein
MASYFNPNVVSKQALKYFEKNRNGLVVEDDTIMGQMVSEILSDVGFEVTSATNGPAAFAELKQRSIDFILLDLLLPEMSGFEIYEKLKASDETQSIPVMIVTAWADSRHMERASELGITHFLAKPFTEDELLLAILTLLIDNSHQQD